MNNILEALQGTAPIKGSDRCKLGKAIADIPADAPGHDELMEAVADARAYPASQLSQVFFRLGYPLGPALVRHHRASLCACYR